MKNAIKLKRVVIFALTVALTSSVLIALMTVTNTSKSLQAYALTVSNPNYSLKGAEYWVYTDEACTERAKTKSDADAVLTTTEDGSTNEIDLNIGTYYVKEKYSSKGYAVDTSVYTVEVKSGDEVVWVNGEAGVKDAPQSAPIKIQKTSSIAGEFYEGTMFELNYLGGEGYEGLNRKWIVKTNAAGYADLSDAYFVPEGSDERYTNSKGEYVVPIGTLTVKETASSPAFMVNKEIATVIIAWDGRESTNETTESLTLTGLSGGDIDVNSTTLRFPNELRPPTYNMYKVRKTDATDNGQGSYGFHAGELVSYDVVIENPNLFGQITLDVSDEFTEHTEYFSKPFVIGVKNAKQNKLSQDKNKVNITINKETTARVTYGAYVLNSAKEYLAPTAKDSDSTKGGKDCNRADKDNTPDDKDGYKNVAKTANIVYKDELTGKEAALPNKEDEAQTPIKVPSIGTYLADAAGRKFVSGEEATLTDTISYKGLTPGETYVFEGRLMLKDSGDHLLENGEPVTAVSGPVVPSEANGSAKVTFKLNANNVQGKQLVAFEKAYLIKDKDGSKLRDKDNKEINKLEIAVHEDLNDENQIVEVPDYDIYKVRNEDAPVAKNGAYGFEPGSLVTYSVVIENKSKMAKLTMDVSDEFTEHPEFFETPYVKEVKNAKENSKSGNEVNITIDPSTTATVILQTRISLNAAEYLAKASKDSDSTKEGKDCNRADKDNTPDDKDGYQNIAKVTNVTAEDSEDPNSGEPAKPLRDKEDDAQTPIKQPEIKTVLKDSNGKKSITASEESILVDTVSYQGFTSGQTYAVIGTLMNKESEEALLREFEDEDGDVTKGAVRSMLIFTAESESAAVNLEFSVDSSELADKRIVAFEKAFNITELTDGTPIDTENPESLFVPDEMTMEVVEEKGWQIAEHEDLEDEDQTVSFIRPKSPETGDNASIGGHIAIFCAAFIAMIALMLIGKGDYLMKTKLFKRKNRITGIIVLLAVVLSSGVSVFADVNMPKSGEKMDFTSAWKYDAVQFTAEDGFKGCCAQLGIERDPEGIGTIDKVYGRNSNMAKVAYYVYSNKLMSSGESPSGFPSVYKEAHLGMNLIQMCNQGKATWDSIAAGEGMGKATRDKIAALYDKIIEGDKVPQRFQALRLQPNSKSQTFVVWRMAPIGRAHLVKSPAGGTPNPAEGATLKGAKYYVYSDEACTKRVTLLNDSDLVLTTKEDGSSNMFSALPGTYWAKEISASPGYDLDPTARKVTVKETHTDDNPATFKSTEPYSAPASGKLKLQKSSSNPLITD